LDARKEESANMNLKTSGNNARLPPHLELGNRRSETPKKEDWENVDVNEATNPTEGIKDSGARSNFGAMKGKGTRNNNKSGR
jgi:hypothetical protein